MIRRPPRSTLSSSSAASDVYKRQMYTLPMAAMTVVFAPLSGRIVGSRGAKLPLVVAGCALIASSLLLTRLSATSSVGWLLMTYVVFGAGFGLVNAPITNTTVSGMPRAQAGVAAAIASTSRQVGQSLGVAVVGAVATAGIHGELRTSFATASHAGWWITAGCGAMVLLLGLATTTGWAKDTAARGAAGAAGGGGRPVGVPAPVGGERSKVATACSSRLTGPFICGQPQWLPPEVRGG